MRKKIKDLDVVDVKRYCNNKSSKVEMGYCAGCPFRLNGIICINTLFLADIYSDCREDITSRYEMRTLRNFKLIYKNPEMEIDIPER